MLLEIVYKSANCELRLNLIAAMKLILSLFALVLLSAVARSMRYSFYQNLQWNHFKEVFHKKYETPEIENKRKAIFVHNLKEIDAHNLLYKRGIESFTMAINELSDMTDSEISQITYKGILPARVG